MTVDSVVQLAWLAGVDAPRLLDEKLAVSDFKFRPLPDAIVHKTKPVRKAAVAADSPVLYITALQISARNPFMAPRTNEMLKIAGVHLKHPTFRDVHFRSLMSHLRSRERRFRHKEKVWFEVTQIHVAAAKVANRGESLSRARVGLALENPGSCAGTLARSYLGWIKRRLKAGDSEVLNPKRVPLDVRAYWIMQKAQKSTKGTEVTLRFEPLQSVRQQ
jgi:hypothetical protein